MKFSQDVTMNSIRRLGFVAAILATCALGYACAGADDDDLFAPYEGPSGNSDGSGDDPTKEPPDDDPSGKDAGSPNDSGSRDASTKDGGFADANDPGDDDASVDPGADAGPPRDVTFFVTSKAIGNDGKIGSLKKADDFCAELAKAANFQTHTWRAYLSTSEKDEKVPTNARDRIGKGPWKNVNGTIIADSVAELHSDDFKLKAIDALYENGESVPKDERIVTGTKKDGTVDPDKNCKNWTQNPQIPLGSPRATAGSIEGASWNSGTDVSCSPNVLPHEKVGRIYCFAAD